MDIPAPAKLILDFIRQTEVGSAGPAGYGIIFGHNEGKLAKPYTTMTVNEVIAAGSGWSGRFGSSASGGYQFMQKTLAGLRDELRLSGGEVMTPDFQDQLGFVLLRRRGYDSFMRGAIDRMEFAKKLAQEWASFPVLQGTKGAHRMVARGETFYAGDKLNKALVKPEAIEALLDRAVAKVGAPIVDGAGVGGATLLGGMGTNQLDIRAIQLLLKNLGYDPGKIDGDLGPLTSAAIMAFQKHNGLPESGMLDAATLTKLRTDGRPRIDPKRVTDTEDDLLKKGSETIKLAKNGRLFGILGMIAGALGFGGTQTNVFSGLGGAVNKVIESAGGTATQGGEALPGGDAFLPLLLKLGASVFSASGGGLWVALFALAFMFLRNSNAVAARRLEDHREGWNIKF